MKEIEKIKQRKNLENQARDGGNSDRGVNTINKTSVNDACRMW